MLYSEYLITNVLKRDVQRLFTEITSYQIEIMSVTEDSPSAERRKHLKQADAANQLRVLASCPLPKYIDIADRLLLHFQDAVDGRRLDEAYVFGLRFANLCLSSLPQHPEWRCDTSSKARKRLTSQVGDVLCMMDVLKQRMDAEELMKIKAEMISKQEEEVRKKKVEERRQQKQDEALQREQSIRNALEQERARFLAEQRAQQQEEELKKKKKIENELKRKKKVEKKKEEVAKKDDIEKSAMAKLQAMQAKMSSTAEQAPQKEVAVVDTKTNTEKPKSSKIKVLGWGKKKSNVKPKEEKATLPTQSSIVEEEVPMLKPQPDSSRQQSDRSQLSEKKLSTRKKSEKKQMVLASTKDQESKVASGQKEQKAKKKNPSHKEHKVEESQDESSTRSASSQIHNGDTDSTRSATSKKNRQKIAPISFVKSKFEAAKSSAKSSISAMPSKIEAAKSSISSAIPSTILQPSTKTSVNDSIVRPSAKTSVNDSAMSTTDTIIAAQQTPRSQKEKATINKLIRAIQLQEDRLEYIEEKQIPSLLEAAKASLKEDKKKEALKCLAHKKRLERQVDTIKAAVFNMETQMFMLESAIEDRHVKKALDEAATAIAGFQQIIDNPNAIVADLNNTTAALPELDYGDSTDEELMEELEQWLSPEERRAQQREDDYNISLLSMPTFLPAAPANAPSTPSVNRILSAVIAGE